MSMNVYRNRLSYDFDSQGNTTDAMVGFSGLNDQGETTMATNSNIKAVPEAMDALEKFKYEVASEVGVTLKDGYNGNISARDAGRIGGNMVRKLIQQAENNMIGK